MRCSIVCFAMVSFASTNSALAEPSAHSIYRCETQAGLVFSDRPCGDQSQLYEPDLSGVSVVQTEPSKPSGSTQLPKMVRPRVAKAPAVSKAEQCQKLNDSLHKIASTMRSGYGAKQGERLKERKRELETRRRAQKC